MNSKRSLMTMVVGVAMLAMPLVAAAKDHNRFDNSRVRVFTPAANVRPVVLNKHDFRHGATWMPAPAVANDWRAHRAWENANAYRNYGNRGYYAPVYAAPVYAAPVGYGGGGYGGGQGCARAQRVMRIYAHDRATGHPAAAADVLRQNRGVMNSGCVGGAPLGRGLGGLGGYGGYGNGGYNGGYGQPYGNGSMLAPLLGYIH